MTKENKKKTVVKNILLYSWVAICSIGGGFLTNYFINTDKGIENIRAANKAIEEVEYVTLEPFLLNLKTNKKGQYDYVKISLSVGISGDENIKFLEENIPQVRDSVLAYLLNQTKENFLADEEVTESLKDNIRNQLNLLFEDEKEPVKEILITDLIVQ